MTILQAQGLAHAFAAKQLFTDVDLRLLAKERLGIVGPNGRGKTTLLQILAGQLEAQAGNVWRAPDLTVGYLHQEALLTFAGQSNTIYDEMLTVFAALTTQEAQLRQLEERLASEPATDDLLDEYGRVQQAYDLGGGYQYQHDIKRVLLGLGFAQESWHTPLLHLSGGQKTRLLLGRLLLEQPQLLILDEPTNHLDVTAVEWLEATLRNWVGSLLIVSHDRYFLDRVATHIGELGPNGLKRYKGGYGRYVAQREQEWAYQESQFQAEKSRLQNELAFVRKNIAGGNTDIAKGRLKRLTRDLLLMEQYGPTAVQGKNWLQIGERLHTLTVNEASQRIDALVSPTVGPPKLNIRLKPDQRSGRFVLRGKKISIGYPENPLFTIDEINVERLDCIALIGANGSGKSTLLRTLIGQISPLRGKLRFDDDLIPGYFAQGHEQLNLDRRVLDELLAHKPMSPQDARRYLAQYLFREDDVFKQVRALSGGERGRLALALLALDGANFLLLDEPTNHLDIPSQEVLQAVLEQFDGTLLLVSHDRYLVDRLATQIWELRDGRLHIFAGTYQEFLAARSAQTATSSTKVALPDNSKPATAVDVSWVDELSEPISRRSKQERRSQRHQISKLREQIEETEAWLDQLDYDIRRAEMAEDASRQAQLLQEATIAQQTLEQLSAELESLLE